MTLTALWLPIIQFLPHSLPAARIADVGGAWEWAEGRPERSHYAKSNTSISSAKSYNTFNWDKAFYSLSGN